MTKKVTIAGAECSRDKFLWILGPCVIESFGTTMAIAEALAALAADKKIQVVFKASFDKANRTHHSAYRGPEFREGVRVLEAVRKRTGLPITTDIHEPWQALELVDVVDLFQIPALLSRQTDLLQAAALTRKPVNLKRGQFMAPWAVGAAVEKMTEFGCGQLLLTERGSCFGHGGVVVDFRGISMMAQTGCPVVFDASHSIQVGTGFGVPPPDRSLIPAMARAAVAFGCHGLFVEVHPAPPDALSDGAVSL